MADIRSQRMYYLTLIQPHLENASNSFCDLLSSQLLIMLTFAAKNGISQPVLLAKWLVSLTSDREVPGSIPTGSRFFCAVTHGTRYSWPGMRVKCIQYNVGYIILGRNARLYFDVKLKYLYLSCVWLPDCMVPCLPTVQ